MTRLQDARVLADGFRKRITRDLCEFRVYEFNAPFEVRDHYRHQALLDGLIEIAQVRLSFLTLGELARVHGHLGNAAIRPNHRVEPALEPSRADLLLEMSECCRRRYPLDDSQPRLGQVFGKELIEARADRIAARDTLRQSCSSRFVDG